MPILREISVKNINGISKEIVYNQYDFPYDSIAKEIDWVYKRRKKGGTYYANIPAAFDIEVTTLKKLDIAHSNVSLETFTGEGFMYHWQFCLDKYVIFGRTWEQFIFFFRELQKRLKLNETRKIVIYVHNLAYEFQFIKDFMKFDSIFAKEARKVIKCSNACFEFRCSYFLSNMSLMKFCQNTHGVVHYKLEDTFDYSIIRTPTPPMSEDNEAYCYNDVRGLCECISARLQEDTIASIPLTATGYVRREYRRLMAKNKNNWTHFQEMALTAEQYALARKAFRGADTHANRHLAGRRLMNVLSADFSSSYPAQILEEYYPMSPFNNVELTTKQELDFYIKKYCVIMQINFFDIEIKENVMFPYIDLGHCERHKGIRLDNGRILKAEFITYTCTEIDFKIIQQEYYFTKFSVEKAMYAVRGRLPKELRNGCLYYFTKKCELKGIEGKEYEYMKSKNTINSTYGMMVTDIAHEEIEYKNGEWVKVEMDIGEQLDHYYKSHNNFLSYQWGVYVTAHARRDLKILQRVCGKDAIYCDTDSCYFRYSKKLVRRLKNFNRLLQLKAERNDIPAFVDVKQKRFYLGTLDIESEPYIYFKTLGAKKYCYYTGDGEFHITVSGMGKKKGAEAMQCIGNFKSGKTFHDIGRTTAFYNERKIKKIRVNGERFLSASNIGILGNTYTLGITGEYYEILLENSILDVDSLEILC